MTETIIDLSVVVITLNEEENLSRCLSSLSGLSNFGGLSPNQSQVEIIVLDSGSTDQTQNIAKSFGARVETRVFDDYASQKNAAVALASRRWVLSLDADEALDEALGKEIFGIVSQPPFKDQALGYRLCRQLIFLGKKMRFGKTIDMPVRLFQRGSGSFLAAIHEHFDVPRHRTESLRRGRLLHESYRDLSDYFARFNNFTSRVAENHFKLGKKPPPLLILAARPFGEFIARYFLRLGFLDGYPGFVYALVSSMYAFVKYAKLRDLCRTRNALRKSL